MTAPASNRRNWALYVLVGGVIAGLGFLLQGNAPSGPKQGEPGYNIRPGDHTVAVSSALACKQADDFHRLRRFLKENDNGAYQREFTRLMLSGACDIWPQGESVVVAEASSYDGMARGHKRGDPRDYWTSLFFLR